MKWRYKLLLCLLHTSCNLSEFSNVLSVAFAINRRAPLKSLQYTLHDADWRKSAWKSKNRTIKVWLALSRLRKHERVRNIFFQYFLFFFILHFTDYSFSMQTASYKTTLKLYLLHILYYFFLTNQKLIPITVLIAINSVCMRILNRKSYYTRCYNNVSISCFETFFSEIYIFRKDTKKTQYYKKSY